MQFTITEFHPCNLPTSPCVFQPSNRPLALTNKLNIVVFVGFPAIGKTTVYKKYFEPKGYVRVDPTSFNRLSDRVEAIEKAIKAKKSVVIGQLQSLRCRRL
jgi:bifunctional polynucleotide phosphatase/kinase